MQINSIVTQALELAKQGKSSPELKILQKLPYRTQVDWTMFPSWAQPVNPEIFLCHEG
jgi:hypothetical protein